MRGRTSRTVRRTTTTVSPARRLPASASSRTIRSCFSEKTPIPARRSRPKARLRRSSFLTGVSSATTTGRTASLPTTFRASIATSLSGTGSTTTMTTETSWRAMATSPASTTLRGGIQRSSPSASAGSRTTTTGRSTDAATSSTSCPCGSTCIGRCSSWTGRRSMSS